MGVIDGQDVSAAVTNPAFINKNIDDVMTNILGFNHPASGTIINDIQKAINTLWTASGSTETVPGTQYNDTGGTVTNGDNYQTAIFKVTQKLVSATPTQTGLVDTFTQSFGGIKTFYANTNQSKVIVRTEFNTTGSILSLESTRTSLANLATSDIASELNTIGRIGGSDIQMAGIYTVYDGNGTTQLAHQSHYVLDTDGMLERIKVDKEGLFIDYCLRIGPSDFASTATTALFPSNHSIYRITGSTTMDIQGIQGGTAGKIIYIHNKSSAVTTLKNENGSATATNRLSLPSSVDQPIIALSTVGLFYDDVAQRWKILNAGSGSNGSGGTTALLWKEPDSQGPSARMQTNGVQVYDFDNQDDQFLFCMFTVPESYVTGTQIGIKNGKVFSSVNTGNFLLRTTSYIFKTNIDGTSTPTGYTSTNTQQTINGTANLITQVSNIDITNATGQINAVAIAAGDTILLKLTRLVSVETSGVAGIVSLLQDSFQLDITF